MSAERDENRVLPQEAFEYGYRAFLEALEILAQEPAQQVRFNGNYNTAFELLLHAGDGRYLAASDVGYLSDVQKGAISHFLDELEQLPFTRHSGCDADPDVRLEANLMDMLHPSWEPIREHAKKLIAVLASATLLNKGYFESLL